MEKAYFCVKMYSLLLMFSIIVPCTSIPSLKSYETLHSVDIKHDNRHKRDASITKAKVVSFTTLGRNFYIEMKQITNLLSPNFKVTSIDEDGKETKVPVDKTAVYEGILTDDSTSFVTAHFEEDNLVATIETQNETYVIEPSWRHLPESESYSMISYKESDLILAHNSTNRKSHCGGIMMPPGEDSDSELLQRSRRAAGDSPGELNTCPMLLVADHRFYKHMGRNNEQTTVNYLIQLIDRVDHIYRNTMFKNGESSFIGYGVEIKDIRIHKTASEQGYNKKTKTDKNAWNIRSLLDNFGLEDYSSWCVAHLFTHQQFTEGTLGLAFIGNTRGSGGICSPRHYHSKYKTDYSLNTGWTTSKDNAGYRVVTRQADLVTAHEIGHNWGSLHDPASKECSPVSKKGGKYIMYTYSVEGYERNNRVFSPCSMRRIFDTVISRAAVCFTQRLGGYCGNSRVEKDEECDAGLAGRQGRDPCCDKNCRLKRPGTCSDVNSLCCSNCSPLTRAAGVTTCFAGGSYNQCLKDSYCDFVSSECPSPQPLANGTPCLDYGKCQNGTCLPMCESNGMESCICDKIEESCLRCCRSKTGDQTECRPYKTKKSDGTMRTWNVVDGRPCARGACGGGKCVVNKGSLALHMWDLFSDLTFDKAVKFMRDNIVGTIIILSLLIWIPAGIIVSYLDRKGRKEETDNVLDEDLLTASRYKPSTHGVDEPVSILDNPAFNDSEQQQQHRPVNPILGTAV